jgi:hypothetical protein
MKMNSHIYGQEPRDFKPGQNVWSHPAMDAFMQGDRSGFVTRIGRKYVHVKMSVSRRYLKFTPDLLAFDIEGNIN